MFTWTQTDVLFSPVFTLLFLTGINKQPNLIKLKHDRQHEINSMSESQNVTDIRTNIFFYWEKCTNVKPFIVTLKCEVAYPFTHWHTSGQNENGETRERWAY